MWPVVQLRSVWSFYQQVQPWVPGQSVVLFEALYVFAAWLVLSFAGPVLALVQVEAALAEQAGEGQRLAQGLY